MAITNLTELVELLKQDPTLAAVQVTRDGTSVTNLRVNPIAGGLNSSVVTSTVTTSTEGLLSLQEIPSGDINLLRTNDTSEQVYTGAQTTNNESIVESYTDAKVKAYLAINDGPIVGTTALFSELAVIDQVVSPRVSNGDILIDNNVISTTVSNSDLELRASGTGKIIADSIQIQGNTIGTTDSSGIEITEPLRTYSSLTVDDDLIVKGTILPLDNKLKIGSGAGAVNQQAFTIAVGVDAGKSNQGSYAVAIGFEAGANQGTSTVAIGPGTAQTNQGNSAVAIGDFAANSGQGTYSVAIGGNAGQTNQTGFAVAVGPSAGNLNQGESSVGVGEAAGYSNQGDFAVAIGFSAARNGQGENAIALGKNAGYSNQHDNSIILNASGSSLNSDGTGRFFVKPVREVATGSPPAGFYQVYYNPTTGEFIYLS